MVINLYFAKPTVKLLNHCDYAKRPADMLMLSFASFFRTKILFWFGKEIPTFSQYKHSAVSNFWGFFYFLTKKMSLVFPCKHKYTILKFLYSKKATKFENNLPILFEIMYFVT